MAITRAVYRYNLAMTVVHDDIGTSIMERMKDSKFHSTVLLINDLNKYLTDFHCDADFIKLSLSGKLNDKLL